MKTVLALLLLVPLVGGQQAVVEDATGDTQGRLPSGETVPIPAGRGLLDLVAIQVEETRDMIVLHLHVASYGEAETTDSAEFVLAFVFENTEFGVLADVLAESLGGSPRASLCRRPLGGEVWGDCREAAITVAPGEPGVITVSLYRADVTNEYGVQTLAGSRLAGFWASSSEFWNRRSIVGVTPSLGSVVWLYDEMPDSLAGAGEFVLAMGGEDAPDVQLTTLRPYRASNGEEATFVYEVAATNSRQTEVDLALGAGELPQGWAVTMGSDALRVAGGETRNFPVIVAIPFGHDHGTLSTFQLQALELQTGASVASVELGVKFLDVPQPSGHHPTLYLHTARTEFTLVEGYGEGFGVQPYLSAQDDDDTDTGSHIGPTSADDFRAPTVFRWCLWLSTPLQLGLDFVDGATGRFEATMTSGLPFSGPLTGRLLATAAPGEQSEGTSVCRPSVDMIPLADLPTVDVDLPGDGATQALGIDVVPTQAVLPYLAGRSLLLEFLMPLDGPAPPLNGILTDVPRFAPGASARLPLEEYHDPPPQFSLGTSDLVGGSPSRVYRNPGATAVFNFTLVSDGGRFDVDLVGTNQEWARVVPSGRVADGDVFHVIVEVPQDQPDGSIADLIVKAIDGRTGEIALAHAVVEVDTEAEHPDDADLASALGESKKAPFSPLGWLAVGLLLAVAKQRRQR